MVEALVSNGQHMGAEDMVKAIRRRDERLKSLFKFRVQMVIAREGVVEKTELLPYSLPLKEFVTFLFKKLFEKFHGHIHQLVLDPARIEGVNNIKEFKSLISEAIPSTKYNVRVVNVLNSDVYVVSVLSVLSGPYQMNFQCDKLTELGHTFLTLIQIFQLLDHEKHIMLDFDENTAVSSKLFSVARTNRNARLSYSQKAHVSSLLDPSVLILESPLVTIPMKNELQLLVYCESFVRGRRDHSTLHFHVTKS